MCRLASSGSKEPDGTGKILPLEVDVPGGGRLKVVSMGLLVDDEDTASMWRGRILAKALEQFLVDVRWGDLDYLLSEHVGGGGGDQAGRAERARQRPHGCARALRRPRRRGRPRRGAERLLGQRDGVRQPERREQPLAQRRVPGLAGELLDHPAGSEKPELQYDQVAPSGWFCAASAEQRDVLLEAVVAAAGVGEDVAVDAAGVGEQVPHGDAAW